MSQITCNPAHVAIIMDGNGRWAGARKKARIHGHRAGIKAAQAAIEAAIQADIPVLTLFAFGQENWRRPEEEVRFLWRLIAKTLRQELSKLDDNGVSLRFIGDKTPLSENLQGLLEEAETKTASHQRLRLNIALNYSGRWDILQAHHHLMEIGQPAETEAEFAQYLMLSDMPEPDLLIRTSGEQRLSNFLLWQLAYTEFVFLPVLWPDFRAEHFLEALKTYTMRQRRYGALPDSS